MKLIDCGSDWKIKDEDKYLDINSVEELQALKEEIDEALKPYSRGTLTEKEIDFLLARLVIYNRDLITGIRKKMSVNDIAIFVEFKNGIKQVFLSSDLAFAGLDYGKLYTLEELKI